MSRGNNIERPMLFNTRMVRAILNGQKTETRRLMKPQPVLDATGMWSWKGIQWMDSGLGFPQSGIENYAPCHLGDLLYVRETWAETPHGIVYRSDGEKPDGWGCDDRWHPSIHMPKKAARIFLRVTDVQAERLQDMSELDAKAEGIKSYWGTPHKDAAPFIGVGKDVGEDLCLTRCEAFGQVWNSTINLSDLSVYGWDVNPWVWVIRFQVERVK